MTLDQQLLLLINGMHTDYLDVLLKIITGRIIWAPLYISIIYATARNFKVQQAALMVIMACVAVAFVDHTISEYIRPVIGRFRPCQPGSPIYELVRTYHGCRSGTYGMPSCHAANSAVVATFFSLALRNRYNTLALWLWMLVLCYSRMYFGVHYPTDLLVGLTIGSVCGLLAWLPFRQFKPNGEYVYIPAVTLVVTYLIIAIISFFN